MAETPSEGLITWLKRPPAEFKEFMARIDGVLDMAKGSALAKGDTEHEKGTVMALQRIIALPQALIDGYETTNTDGTDSDT